MGCRSCEWLSGEATAGYPAGNERDQSSETDDQHHTHYDDQDLERPHASEPDRRQVSDIDGHRQSARRVYLHGPKPQSP